MDKARPGVVQILNQSDSTGNRRRTKEQRNGRRKIGRRKQTKTSEDNRKPKYQQDEEGNRDAVPAAHFQRPPGLDEIARQSHTEIS